MVKVYSVDYFLINTSSPALIKISFFTVNDGSFVADRPQEPDTPTNEQIANAVEIVIQNFKEENVSLHL